jgi:hypothetical protein
VAAAASWQASSAFSHKPRRPDLAARFIPCLMLVGLGKSELLQVIRPNDVIAEIA